MKEHDAELADLQHQFWMLMGKKTTVGDGATTKASLAAAKRRLRGAIAKDVSQFRAPVRACRTCGRAAGGWHKCCPRCGMAVFGIDDIGITFGWRRVGGVKIPQTWCRSCRSGKRSEVGDE